jgi:hypothetical protein
MSFCLAEASYPSMRTLTTPWKKVMWKGIDTPKMTAQSMGKD